MIYSLYTSHFTHDRNKFEDGDRIVDPNIQTQYRQLQIAGQMHSSCRFTCWKYNNPWDANPKRCRFEFPFEMDEARLPDGKALSEGDAVIQSDRDAKSRVRWRCHPPRNNALINNTYRCAYSFRTVERPCTRIVSVQFLPV
jgi:hypothetical protein